MFIKDAEAVKDLFTQVLEDNIEGNHPMVEIEDDYVSYCRESVVKIEMPVINDSVFRMLKIQREKFGANVHVYPNGEGSIKIKFF